MAAPRANTRPRRAIKYADSDDSSDEPRIPKRNVDDAKEDRDSTKKKKNKKKRVENSSKEKTPADSSISRKNRSQQKPPSVHSSNSVSFDDQIPISQSVRFLTTGKLMFFPLDVCTSQRLRLFFQKI
jgi:hypothetical protein